MNKWMYDRMVEEYSKESKEELAQRIMAANEIECKDRSFANQCQAGNSIYHINELFEAIEDLKNCFVNPTEKTLEKYTNNLWMAAENAKNDWEYIKRGIAEMNDCTRSANALSDFKSRVANAKSNHDSI